VTRVPTGAKYSPVAGAQTGRGGGQRGLNVDEEGRTAGERNAAFTDERNIYNTIRKAQANGEEVGQDRAAWADQYENRIRGGRQQQGGQQQLRQITTQTAYDALPSGTEFIAPDGSHRRKP
jgi:hypothetical protein